MVNVDRHARHLLLPEVGIEGQRRIQQASVLIIGAGGLGSPVAMYLAAAGVGRIGLVDDDTVDLSNLQRQLLHGTKDVGRPKVVSAEESLLGIDPGLCVEIHHTRLSPENALSLMGEGWDIVVDGTDNLPTRYLIDDACALLGLPWVYGSVFRFEGQVTVFGHDGGPRYRDLYPVAPPPGAVQGCNEAGVLGVLPGLVGTLQATEVLKTLIGVGPSLSGRLLVIDTMDMAFRHLKFEADPSRPEVTDLDAAAAMVNDPAWCLPAVLAPSPEQSNIEGAQPQGMMQSLDMTQFLARRTEGWAPFILDVRSNEEYEAARVASCGLQVPHTDVLSELANLPAEGDIVVHCRSGMRSQMAIMVLIQAGVDSARLYNLDGGIQAWSMAKPDEIIP